MPAYGSQLGNKDTQKKAPLPLIQNVNQQNDPLLHSPQMNQLPTYHDGGDVPEDQVAKLKGGERVLTPVETHAYKSAALGNAPDTPLGRIATRAHELYDQGKALSQPLDKEAEAFKEKQQSLDTAMKPMAPASKTMAPVVAPSASDRVNPSAEYGMHSGEKRLSPEGSTIDPTTPKGLGAVGPKMPEPNALKSLPSYDDGGNVPDDQVAKVHEDEHVLDPEKAAAYKQAEQEEAQSQDSGAKVFPNPHGAEVKSDTEPANVAEPVVGTKMDTSPYTGGAGMQEVSTKTPLGPKVAQSSGMKHLPLQVKPEETKPVAEQAPAAPDPMAIIQQDKMAAAAKGTAGLSDLGTAMIHEKLFAPKPAYTGTAKDMKQENQKEGKERYEETVKNLTDKMLHGATEQERFQAEKDLAEYKRRTPLGGDESARPGTLGKVEHVLGRIGQAALIPTAPYLLPAIPGTQANLAAQEVRGEQGVEQAQGEQLKEAQIATEEQKPEIKQAQADVAEQKLQNAQSQLLRKQGLKVDAAGNQIPLTYEEMSLPEQGAYDLQQAKSNAQNSIAELKKAQADPDSPQSQAILAKVKNEARRIDIAAQKVGIDADKYKADYLGVDHDGNPLAGTTTDEKGNPVGVKVGKANETTAMRLNKADLSQNVQLNAANAIKMINDNTDLFGKIAGRYTNTRQMAGSGDEAIKKLAIEVHNIAVASAGIHGQRSQAAVEAYEKDVLNKFHDSPKATIAGLNEISGSVQTFIEDAKAGKKVAPNPLEEKVPTAETAKYHVKGKAGEIISNDGKTWYDLQGKKIENKKKGE